MYVIVMTFVTANTTFLANLLLLAAAVVIVVVVRRFTICSTHDYNLQLYVVVQNTVVCLI